MSHAFPRLNELEASLDALDQQSLRRVRRVLGGPCAPDAHIDGASLLAFASNDYLGLANDPRLIAAACEGAQRWGVGAGASHLVSGHYAVHEELAASLARFTGFEAALTFSTGYMANIAVMPALLGREDAVFADKLNHASLIDGALLSRAEVKRYQHYDMAQLETLLVASSARRKLIVSDAVFSMDGDIAPLKELLRLAEVHDAWLLIDDAHGFGVLGPQGRGSLAEAGLQSDRLILMGTLGKAAGVAGAFVAGSRLLIEWLVQRARAYIFTTAAPPMIAHTLSCALELIESADAQRAHLQSLIERLRKGLARHASRLLPSRTAIQPLLVGGNAETLALTQALLERGIWVPAIRPPTVPQGSARLRISLSAAHTVAHVDTLVEALNDLLPPGSVS